MSEPLTDGLTENTLSSELLYDGRVVHLYMETVRLPNGKCIAISHCKRFVVSYDGQELCHMFTPNTIPMPC